MSTHSIGFYEEDSNEHPQHIYFMNNKSIIKDHQIRTLSVLSISHLFHIEADMTILSVSLY